MRLKACLVIPVALQYASLADQRVLERRVDVQEAVVVTIDDVVSVFRCLLSCRNVFRPLWGVFNCVVSAMEYAH